MQEGCAALKWCLGDGLMVLCAAYTFMCFGGDWYSLVVFGLKTTVVAPPTPLLPSDRWCPAGANKILHTHSRGVGVVFSIPDVVLHLGWEVKGGRLVVSLL